MINHKILLIGTGTMNCKLPYIRFHLVMKTIIFCPSVRVVSEKNNVELHIMKQTMAVNDKSQMCAIYNGLEKIYTLVKFEVKTLVDLKELLSDYKSKSYNTLGNFSMVQLHPLLLFYDVICLASVQ